MNENSSKTCWPGCLPNHFEFSHWQQAKRVIEGWEKDKVMDQVKGCLTYDPSDPSGSQEEQPCFASRDSNIWQRKQRKVEMMFCTKSLDGRELSHRIHLSSLLSGFNRQTCPHQLLSAGCRFNFTTCIKVGIKPLKGICFSPLPVKPMLKDIPSLSAYHI